MNNTPVIAKIDIEYGCLGKVMEWCRENCHSDWWILDVSYSNSKMSHYEFKFYDEQDMLMFELRWR